MHMPRFMNFRRAGLVALTTGLGAVAQAQDFNPYRGQATVHEAGRQAYSQHCAQCHGVDASQPMAEAPDLRRLDSFCRRLRDPVLKSDCTADVDRYYLRSVHEGKVRAGVVHMPAWKDVLTPQQIWSIRTFVETRPLDPPKRTTSVDARHAAESPVAASGSAR